jgi:hypothetical protein
MFASRCSCRPDVCKYFRSAAVLTHIEQAVTRTVVRQQMGGPATAVTVMRKHPCKIESRDHGYAFFGLCAGSERML